MQQLTQQNMSRILEPINQCGITKMIETITQAIAAVEEIRALTGWPDAEIARRAGVNRATINRIKTGKMKFPGYETRLALANCLVYVRGIKQ